MTPDGGTETFVNNDNCEPRPNIPVDNINFNKVEDGSKNLKTCNGIKVIFTKYIPKAVENLSKEY